jgi:hypothetical protein
MLLVSDIILGGVGIINKLIEIHELNKWFRVIFGFVFSFVVGFCVACGKHLIAGDTLVIGIGYGMIYGSAAMNALFIMHPKTRGIVVAYYKDNIPDTSEFQTMEKK